MPNNTGKRASKREMIQRIDYIYGLLLDGRSTADILELGQEKWGVSEGAVETYLIEAHKEHKRVTSQSRQETYDFVLKSLIDVARRQRRKNPFVYISALQQISKIAGLEKLPVEVEKDDMPSVSESELMESFERESAIH